MWWQKLGEAKPNKGITLKQFLKFTVTHYHLLVCGVLQKIWNIAVKSTSQKLVFIPNNLPNQMRFCFYWWWWDTKKQQISSSTAKSNLLTVIVRETAKLFSNPWPCHSIQSQQQAITRLWIPQDRPLNSPKGKDIEFRSGHSTDAWSSSVNGKWVLLDPLWNTEIMYSISAQIKMGFCKQLR